MKLSAWHTWSLTSLCVFGLLGLFPSCCHLKHLWKVSPLRERGSTQQAWNRSSLEGKVYFFHVTGASRGCHGLCSVSFPSCLICRRTRCSSSQVSAASPEILGLMGNSLEGRMWLSKRNETSQDVKHYKSISARVLLLSLPRARGTFPKALSFHGSQCKIYDTLCPWHLSRGKTKSTKSNVCIQLEKNVLISVYDVISKFLTREVF